MNTNQAPQGRTILGIRLFSVGDVAVLLDVSTKTINRAIKDGSFPARRIGGSWFISERRLKEYLEAVEPEVRVENGVELVARTGIELDEEWDYFVDEEDGHIYRQRGRKMEQVALVSIACAEGWSYFIHPRDGHVYRRMESPLNEEN